MRVQGGKLLIGAQRKEERNLTFWSSELLLVSGFVTQPKEGSWERRAKEF